MAGNLTPYLRILERSTPNHIIMNHVRVTTNGEPRNGHSIPEKWALGIVVEALKCKRTRLSTSVSRENLVQYIGLSSHTAVTRPTQGSEKMEGTLWIALENHLPPGSGLVQSVELAPLRGYGPGFNSWVGSSWELFSHIILYRRFEESNLGYRIFQHSIRSELSQEGGKVQLEIKNSMLYKANSLKPLKPWLGDSRAKLVFIWQEWGTKDQINAANVLSTEKAMAMVDTGMERHEQLQDKGPTQDHKDTLEQRIGKGYMCGESLDVPPYKLKEAHHCNDPAVEPVYYATQDTRGGKIVTTDICAVCYEPDDLVVKQERLESGPTKEREPLPIFRDCFDSGMHLVFSENATHFKTKGQEDKLNKEKKRKTLKAAGKRQCQKL
eukprot:scaffold21618_cov63-Attheya_sp.AAC.12